MTYGEGLQQLNLATAVQLEERYLYVCHLLQELLPFLVTPSGINVSTTTLRTVYSTLEQLGLQRSGRSHRLAFRDTLTVFERCFAHSAVSSIPMHRKLIQRVRDCAAQVLSPPHALWTVYDSNGPIFVDLSDDLLGYVCKFLDHPDILSLSKTCQRLRTVCSSESVWKNVALSRFPSFQVSQYLPRTTEEDGKLAAGSWKQAYRQCLRAYRAHRYGDVYGDTLAVCTSCNTLFWKAAGHRVQANAMCTPAHVRSVLPAAFLPLFRF
eukprot:m.139882 g.139882  ORF g.139882 m.139882 type:complete len:266 (-) comp20321_c0_seq8:191-988(-)